jgi:hypothetical protein
MPATQDGSQIVNIPASPITINSKTYILESFTISVNGKRAEIADDEGTATGAMSSQGLTTFEAVCQMADSGSIPTFGQTFSYSTATWVIDNISEAYTQGGYAKVNISGWKKINA